ncbi:MAG: S8 family serine peptidase [Tissierellaceae bacterium]
MTRPRYDKLCPILNAKIMAQTTEKVPVIVQFKDNSRYTKETLQKIINQAEPNLPIIDAYSGHLSTDLIYRLSEDPNISYISFDSKVYTLLDIATESMEAYFPHDKGYEGEDVTVAIIDTGVAPHYDLIRPMNRIIGFKDFINYRETIYDDNGHGTHVTESILISMFSAIAL